MDTSSPEALEQEKHQIRAELKAIHASIDRNTEAQDKRARNQWIVIGLMGAVFIVVTILGVVGYIDDTNDDQREKDRIEQQRLADCVLGKDGRDDAEDRLVDLARSLGASDHTVNAIHDSYDDAPPLAACTSVDDKAADSG